MKKKSFPFVCLFLLCCLFLFPLSAQAAPKKHHPATHPSAKKYVSTWRTVKGRHYLYNKKGKKCTGITRFKNRWFYFDSKGVERSGWQQVGNDYYFFRISPKRKCAYMLTATKVNGIPLDSRGRARKSGSNLRKLKLLVTANKTMQQITTPDMTKSQKLRACFDYVRDHYRYFSWRNFVPKPDWEMDFAEDMFYRGGRGDCFSYGAAFAYLANAVGMKNVYAISSGGHGWAEIGGKIYDPDWALVSKADSYFAMSYDLSGINGRPLYKTSRAYAAKI